VHLLLEAKNANNRMKKRLEESYFEIHCLYLAIKSHQKRIVSNQL